MLYIDPDKEGIQEQIKRNVMIKDNKNETGNQNTALTRKELEIIGKINRTKTERLERLQFGRTLIEKLSHKLKRHKERNENTTHVNKSLYHLLCHPYTFVNAYTKISKNKGALTKGIQEDKEINLFFGQGNAIRIANKFKQRKFDWNPVRRVMIEKPGNKSKRPIDTPTQENRIVQEALRGILEAIYEPEFREFENLTKGYCNNYGFRPGKSTWQAVDTLKVLGQGTTQVIEGDIVGAYNNVDHDILVTILSKRITDKLFLSTIKDMLKAGIFYEKTHIHSLIGTPQGGIVSPLLFNIYFFEFDKYVYETYILPLQSTQYKPKNNSEYKRLQYKSNKLLKSYREAKGTTEAVSLLKSFKEVKNSSFKVPSRIPETLPKIACYVRYADDWVLTITGSTHEAETIKTELASYLYKNLKLQLDPIKTSVTSLTEGFDFLGFHIQTWDEKQIKKAYYIKKVTKSEPQYIRFMTRSTSRQISIYPSQTRLHSNLLRNKFCTGINLTPIAKSGWTALDEFEIVLKFQQVLRGIINYYRYCPNKKSLNRVSYILQYSCAKTLAYRQKTTISKIFVKYGKNMTITRDVILADTTKQRKISFQTSSELLKTMDGRIHTKKPFDPFYIHTY